jgi:CubicO group peptidase (beta-lactamase class C family)
MGELKVEVEAGEAGFDADRLSRIDTHFRRYVDDGRLPGWLVLVARHGQVAHLSTYGSADLEAGAPVEHDTLWRIFSMTKPITSVAAMMLYEEGAFELKDPISRWIPSFASTKVYRSGSTVNPVLEPQIEPIRVWHLLTHMSGLTYGFHHATPVDAMYRAAGYEWGRRPG